MDISKEMLVDIVINIINILVLFFVVRALAYKPVKKFMNARAEKALKEKNDAEALQVEANEKIAEYTALTAQSKKAMEKAVAEGEREGREEAARIIAEAEEKAQKLICDAKEKAEELRQKTLEEAQADIVEVAIEASEKLLLREVTDEDNKRFVERFIGERAGGNEKNA